jgi:hypothetical protein
MPDTLQFKVSDNEGLCLHMQYGYTQSYGHIRLSPDGFMDIKSSGNKVSTDGEILLTNTTNATASSGAVIIYGGVSVNKDIYTTSTVIADIPISTSSGGTGFNTYANGDLITGNTSNSLIKVNAPSNTGYLLTSNAEDGTYWGYKHITDYYTAFPSVAIISSGSYIFGPFYGRDSTGMHDIALSSSSYAINLAAFGLGGIGVSASSPTGLIYPDPTSTTITGIGTLFTIDTTTGVVISCNGQTRKIVSIINDTSVVIDTPFTLLNLWSLGSTGILDTAAGTMKFGAASFGGTNATSTNATINIGFAYQNYTSSNTKPWTLEFWYRPTTVVKQSIVFSTTANTFTLIMANTGVMSISLGQGASFNIANGLTITGTQVANTYKHIAIVFTGSAYNVYVNGVNGRSVASALPVSTACFNAMRIGADGTNPFNGHIDEFRMSNTARYTTTFTPATSEFVVDANTMSLNHFNNTASITQSDDTSTMISANEYPYTIDTSVYANTVYYAYAITDMISNNAYVFNSSSDKPNMPSGYTKFARVPFYAITNGSGSWTATNYSNGYYQLINPITMITGATNVSPTILNTPLLNFVPVSTKKIELLITHTHVGTTSAGIMIGHNSYGLNTILTTAVAGTSQIQLTVPLAMLSLDTCLSAASNTTSYTIQLTGFYV